MTSIVESPVFEEILRRYVSMSERVFKDAVESSGKVLTAEMLNSIKAGAIERGKGFISGHVHFDAILRIKDMKTLNYSTVPPFQAMANFVDKVGPEKFAYVPGYENKPRPSREIQVKRIAGGLQNHFRRVPNVKRGYRGLYNEPLTKQILPLFFNDLRQSAGAGALGEFRAMFR